MICRTCGRELQKDTKFCPYCGAEYQLSIPAYMPELVAQANADASSDRKKKTGWIIGGVIAAAAVIAILIAVMSGLFSRPKGQLEKAVKNSAAAYEAAGRAMGLPDLYQLTEARSVSQQIALRLNSVNSLLLGTDASSLSGLGLRMNTGLDGSARRLDLELGAFWDEDDLLSLRLTADDNKLYFASPQFTDGIAYGVNTETLGADMAELGGEDVEHISFNLFDLADLAVSSAEKRQEAKEALQNAGKVLWEEAQVERDGRETITVNQNERKTDAYQVTIPQEALAHYADALVQAIEATDYIDLYTELLRSMGVPEADIFDFLDGLEGADPYGELEDSLDEFVEELGDVRLRVHISGGYVAAVRYFDDDDAVALSLYLGGGEEYVDDLRLEVMSDGQMLATIDSTGNHGGKNGIFTDTTTLRYGTLRLNSDFSWEPKSGALQWELGADGAGTLEMMGTLTAGQDSVDVKLDNISLRVMGMEVCSLGLDCSIGPCAGITLPETAPKLISEMGELELLALMTQVQTRAEQWVTDMEALFARRLPAELYDMIA